MSHLIKELCTLTGTKKSRTTPYHSMGNGMTERFNRTLLEMLWVILVVFQTLENMVIGLLSCGEYNCMHELKVLRVLSNFSSFLVAKFLTFHKGKARTSIQISIRSIN
jgi:transposase InsO family protein